jgi:hypothetical protein
MYLIEEQRARLRRLLEMLITLILFSETNEQEYYRDMLLVEELRDLLAANLDLEDFHACRGASIDDSIERHLTWIRDTEESIDLSKAWYRFSPEPLPPLESLRVWALLSSARSRMKKGMPLMTDKEKLLFGFSYGGFFAGASEALHWQVNPRAYRPLRAL